MPFCPKCGSEVHPDAQFCYTCGKNMATDKAISGTPRQAEPVVPAQPPVTPARAPIAPNQMPLAPTAPVQPPVTPAQASIALNQTPLAPAQVPIAPNQEPLAPAAPEQRPVPSAPAQPKEKKPLNKKLLLGLALGVLAVALVILAVVLLLGKSSEKPKADAPYAKAATEPLDALQGKDGLYFILENGECIRLDANTYTSAVITPDRAHIVALDTQGRVVVMDKAQKDVRVTSLTIEGMTKLYASSLNMTNEGVVFGGSRVRFAADGPEEQKKLDPIFQQQTDGLASAYSQDGALYVQPYDQAEGVYIADVGEVIYIHTSAKGEIVTWIEKNEDDHSAWVWSDGQVYPVGNSNKDQGMLASFLLSVSKDEKLAVLCVSGINTKAYPQKYYLLQSGQKPVEMAVESIYAYQDIYGRPMDYVFCSQGPLDQVNASQVDTLYCNTRIEGFQAYSLKDHTVKSYPDAVIYAISGGTLVYMDETVYMGLSAARLEGQKLTQRTNIFAGDTENRSYAQWRSFVLSENGQYVYFTVLYQAGEGRQIWTELYSCRIGDKEPELIGTFDPDPVQQHIFVSQDGKTVYYAAGVTDLEYIYGADEQTREEIYGLTLYTWSVDQKELTVVHEKVGEIYSQAPINGENGIVYRPVSDNFVVSLGYDQAWYYFDGSESQKLFDIE